ncbi:ScpA family protein [Paralimibaculum aggregatum]|uniref:Segregation and condensation protein A n=1 Tax=Paralimibaculum aggregatum TaxID=3036245 RepID=A0ABQ6LKE0_9RHOB|nr:ScpA family protein [Limibaculum sp. NKW23]GMG83716.1 ScpA family protein [Limibaculum sp. NKW23]
MTPFDERNAAAEAAPEAPAETAPGPDAMVVDVEGFEGPLDMLLALARVQKVDLRRISVLRLAEQYLAFVEGARLRRIELAADYLVMAAWLAYLKSRLLLPPEPGGEEPSGEELAARLAARLERLDAMRKAAAQLMARDLLGQDRFVRGQTEVLSLRKKILWQAGLADLLRAYSRVKARDDYRPLALARPDVVAIDAALARLRRGLGSTPDWRELSAWLPGTWSASPERRRSAIASSFVAALELVREGAAEIHQERSFAPILLRARRPEPAGEGGS